MAMAGGGGHEEQDEVEGGVGLEVTDGWELGVCRRVVVEAGEGIWILCSIMIKSTSGSRQGG